MPRKKVTNNTAAESVITNEEPVTTVEPPKPVKRTAKRKVLRRVPPTTLVPVMSNCTNPLIYNSRRQNGYVVEWDSYGTVEYMEVSELIAMRSTALRFYSDNWIVILDSDDLDAYTAEEIYNTIGVAQYYKNTITPDTIGDFLKLDADAIRSKMSDMSIGLRRTIYDYALREKESGNFDSIERLLIIKEMAGYTDD